MENLFIEKQKFTQWWVWVILLFSIIFHIVDAEQVSSVYLLIMLLIIVFIYSITLTVKVKSEGLHYQFFPIHFKSHIIYKHDIEKLESLQYNPILDYGGWGIRHRFKGKAYNIRGNKGVKIYMKNGKTILFGSQKYKELEKALNIIKKQL